MYKGVVFDLDGTLVDSRLCFQTIRKQLDIPEGEYILEYLETIPENLRAEKLERLESIEIDAAKNALPFPGALDLVEELQAQKIKVGIFTRNCRAATQHFIEFHGMKFDMVITREDAPPKPNPIGIQKFLTDWNLSGPELLFVGDVRSDIECGKQAGIATALFTNGSKHPEEWNPHHVIPDFSGFWKCISTSILATNTPSATSMPVTL